MPRIVFASDSHLNKHYARMTPDQLSERRARLRAGLQHTIDYAVAQRVDAYIHGGDLFDGPNPRAVELIWTAKQFRRLARAGVASYLIGGNHDIPRSRTGGVAPQRLLETVEVARVFTDPTRVEWDVVIADGVRIAIGGLPPDPRFGPEDDPLAGVVEGLDPPAADVRILVTHYGLEGWLHPLANEAVMSRDSVGRLAGSVDWLLVGHIHEPAEIDVGGVRVVFPGPTERMSFGELDVSCGFVVLEVEGTGREVRVRSRTIPLDPQPMRRATVQASEVPRIDPTDWLMRRLRGVSRADQILQLRLKGAMERDTYHALRFREVWSLGNELNFYFDLDRRGLTVQDPAVAARADDPGRGSRVSPRVEIRRVADAMAAGADRAEDREAIEAARDLVLARYGARRVEDADSAPAGEDR